MDTEGQLYLHVDFPLCGAGLAPPNLHVVDGSPVIAQGRLSRQKVQHDQNPGGLNQKL